MTQEAVEAINLRLFCQSQHQQSFEGNLLSEMNSRDKIVDINDIKRKPILLFTKIIVQLATLARIFSELLPLICNFFYCNKYVKCEIHPGLPWKTAMHIAPHSIYVQISVTNVNDFKRTKISGWRTLYVLLFLVQMQVKFFDAWKTMAEAVF